VAERLKLRHGAQKQNFVLRSQVVVDWSSDPTRSLAKELRVLAEYLGFGVL
jgi:hypothetical protein